MKNTYIDAVLQMIESGEEPGMVLSGLKNTLAQRGHDRLYVSVLNGVLRVLEANSGTTTTVTVSDEATAVEYADAIKQALTTLGADKSHEVVIDKTLVGGFIAEHNSKRIDQSYKTKLITLYRSLTS